MMTLFILFFYIREPYAIETNDHAKITKHFEYGIIISLFTNTRDLTISKYHGVLGNLRNSIKYRG